MECDPLSNNPEPVCAGKAYKYDFDGDEEVLLIEDSSSDEEMPFVRGRKRYLSVVDELQSEDTVSHFDASNFNRANYDKNSEPTSPLLVNLKKGG